MANKNLAMALKLFSVLTVWIAGPIIIALYLGKWLDDKYQTSPWLFLTCLLAAFLVSNIGIVKEALKAMKALDKNK